MSRTYVVPVRESQAGTLALRTGRLLSGERVGLAFTSEVSLAATLGPSQHWVRLAEEPLRDMLAPLGVDRLRIDPRPAGEAQGATGDAQMDMPPSTVSVAPVTNELSSLARNSMARATSSGAACRPSGISSSNKTAA
jgi:hypothetical protein